jgi:hypothetical protein
MHLW